MMYLGGKSRLAKPIAEFLESVRCGMPYFEPFVGGGWVLQEMSGVREACDAHPALIAMYQALQKGWLPPERITEEEYAAARTLPDSDPLKAFVGFGCSFGGKWFGGYARGGVCSYAATTRRSLLRQLPKIKDVRFHDARSYATFNPHMRLIYCDPPYAGTTGYSQGAFDSAAFWNCVREWSLGNLVVVSEYAAPPDFVCVKEYPTTLRLRSKDGRAPRTEKLFMHKTRAP